MRCGTICSRQVQLAPLQASARDAAMLMARWEVGSLVVIDGHERPIGMLTDRDLVLRILAPGADAEHVVVGEVMSPFPTTIPEEASVEEALEVMRGTGVRRLPVVRGDGALVGILTLDDLVSLLAAELGAVQDVVQASTAHHRDWTES